MTEGHYNPWLWSLQQAFPGYCQAPGGGGSLSCNICWLAGREDWHWRRELCPSTDKPAHSLHRCGKAGSVINSRQMAKWPTSHGSCLRQQRPEEGPRLLWGCRGAHAGGEKTPPGPPTWVFVLINNGAARVSPPACDPGPGPQEVCASWLTDSLLPWLSDHRN